MSINLLAIRWHLDHAGPLHKDECVAMCDEIDRLRECDRKRCEEYVEVRQELDTLREQLRPRSIKDEPPPLDEWILAWPYHYSDENTCWWPVKFSHKEAVRDTRFTLWVPELPAPPAPDKFEEWAKKRFEGCPQEHVWLAKEGWDAAKKDEP